MSNVPHEVDDADSKVRRRTDGFAQVEHAVLRDPCLSAGAKTLYSLLVGHKGVRGTFPSQKTLAAEMGRSPRTVQRLLRELETAGLVKTKRTGLTKTNRYMLLGPNRPSLTLIEGGITTPVGSGAPAPTASRLSALEETHATVQEATTASRLDATSASAPSKKNKEKENQMKEGSITTRAGDPVDSFEDTGTRDETPRSDRPATASEVLAIFNEAAGTDFLLAEWPEVARAVASRPGRTAAEWRRIVRRAFRDDRWWKNTTPAVLFKSARLLAAAENLRADVFEKCAHLDTHDDVGPIGSLPGWAAGYD